MTHTAYSAGVLDIRVWRATTKQATRWENKEFQSVEFYSSYETETQVSLQDGCFDCHSSVS